MTFDDLDLPVVSSGFGVWKATEKVVDDDWAAAENALCEAAMPVIDEKRTIIKGYQVTKSERLNKLTLFLLR